MDGRHEPPWLVPVSPRRSPAHSMRWTASLAIEAMGEVEPWLRQPAAAEARWRSAQEMAEAAEIETPPWLLNGAGGSGMQQCDDTDEEEEEFAEPPALPPPNCCTTCGALHRGPVCRCITMTMSHPITRILARAAVSPPASPPITQRSRSDAADATPLSTGRAQPAAQHEQSVTRRGSTDCHGPALASPQQAVETMPLPTERAWVAAQHNQSSSSSAPQPRLRDDDLCC